MDRQTERDETVSGNMPDEFDRLLAQLHGLPDVEMTQPAVRQVIESLVGNTQTFIVRTVRQTDGDEGGKPRFIVFLEVASKALGHKRIVIPPAVSDVITRQRERLTSSAKSRASRRAAETLRERGHVPVFTPEMRAKALRTRRAKAEKRRARRQAKGGAR